jgi:hypothetical protein
VRNVLSSMARKLKGKSATMVRFLFDATGFWWLGR